jgi:hypothetical protein
MADVKVSEEQVLHFRARRGHLAGKGAKNVTEAARSIVGAQSQQLQPSLLALSMRTAGRPTAVEVQAEIFTDSRTLVRTWGQRDTIHVYDAENHWRRVVTASQIWSPGGRDGQLPNEAALNKALAAIERFGGIATRGDLLKVTPAAFVKVFQERAQMAKIDPKRFAAGRLLWRLAHLGELSIGEKIGAEQSYVSRQHWFNSLPWPELDAEQASMELTRDYLRVYGPATPHDVAHFFGAKVTLVRQWLQRIGDELISVSCADRKGLTLLSEDVTALRRKPPAESKDWPVRLLPLWESMLMGHADKSWTVPNEAERKQIWRKSAMVASVVLDRGRVVATWTQKATRKQLTIQVAPLSCWRKTKHHKGAEREAEAIAAHLQLPDVELKLV